MGLPNSCTAIYTWSTHFVNPVYSCMQFLSSFLALAIDVHAKCRENFVTVIPWGYVVIWQFTAWAVTFLCVIIKYLGNYNLHDTVLFVATINTFSFIFVFLFFFCGMFLQILCSFTKAIKSRERVLWCVSRVQLLLHYDKLDMLIFILLFQVHWSQVKYYYFLHPKL